MRPLALVLVGLLAACRSTTQPGCSPTTAAPLTTPLSFVADVDSARFSTGIPPGGGIMSEYEFWVTVRPKSAPDTYLYTRPSTPVFLRRAADVLRPSAACVIRAGDVLEVWRDSTEYGWADGPAGRTWSYYPTQLVIRR